jgi:hypothetical protein
MLKIRAKPLRRMPKSVFFAKLRVACRHGVVPDDIEISTLNWGHGTGTRYDPGETLSGADRDELRNCYDYLVSGADIRFERPD